MISLLPSVNATLNATAAVLLIWGYLLIRRKRIQTHRKVMLTAFGVSSLFLVCYLVYHFQVGSVRYQKTGALRAIYLSILASHTLLAAAVPPLAIVTLNRGLRARSNGLPAGCRVCQGRPHVISGGREERCTCARGQALRSMDKHRRIARWTLPIWLYVSVTGVVVYVMLYRF